MENKEIWLETLITNSLKKDETYYKNGKKVYRSHTNRCRNKEKLRSDYANDTAQLIASANVIAIEFRHSSSE
jgi:hypothetical protein